ncbi:hypothetical protein C0Q70_12094 [Pomacea canaliculata]|uniref:Ig-like domain-containing protein n=1 Tax=Pomacea canaliculata TaxID=400727 RepID=A0A2T7P0K8_POMCA|nr:uncharacterized protein LOC112568935 [Pomacea canaliculata]XP_025102294.1 uncharacterized protein LOC112568935 [Pomacea canaliculata]XP_025102295.1 uncharacterized protein LOC112568935 [Pomacea canaliculata]PVD26946.1 hypothetical protein C0Q70_12094 [Pomacea canaliculata]
MQNEVKMQNFQRSYHYGSWNPRLVLTTACLATLLPLAYGVRPACDIPPADLMEPTTLTCYFPKKVFHSKSDFKVFHISRKASVVNATWEDGELLFSLGPGYALDGQSPTDRITFKIDHVTLNQTGRYACVPAGYEYRNVGTCTLSLKSGRSKTPREAASVQDVGETGHITLGVFVLMLAAFIIPCVILVIVTVYLITYIKERRYIQDLYSVDCTTVEAQAAKESLVKTQDSMAYC